MRASTESIYDIYANYANAQVSVCVSVGDGVFRDSIVLTAQCGLLCRSSLATGTRRVCVIFGIPLYF